MIRKIKNKLKFTQIYNIYIKANLRKKVKRLNKLSRLEQKNLQQREINKYYAFYGVKPNLCNPQTFSEKILWSKFYFCNELCTCLVDKQKVKEISKEILKIDLGVKTLKTFENTKNINFNDLPDRFVIKMNNGSGHIFLGSKNNGRYRFNNIKTKGGRYYSEEGIKRFFKILFQLKYAYENYELPYCDIKPLVIIEEFLDEKNLTDYKFHMNYGKFIFLNVVTGRQHILKDDYYDENLNRMDIRWDNPPSENPNPLPKEIEQMKKYACILSKELPISRIDFYISNKRIYLGEITLYQNGGYFNIEYPKDLDLILGKKFDISRDLGKEQLKAN